MCITIFILCQLYVYECMLDSVYSNLYVICAATHVYIGLAMGTRNPMGFYSIRARVWVNFLARGSANGPKFKPIGFAGSGLGT